MPQFKTDFGLHYMAACNDNYNLCAPQEGAGGDATPGSQIEYRRVLPKNDKKKLKKSGSQKSILKNEPNGQAGDLTNFKRDIEVNKNSKISAYTVPTNCSQNIALENQSRKIALKISPKKQSR